jgi:SulP family sulfate permease
VNAVGALSFASIKLILVPSLTLSVLLSIDTLKTCVALDALTHTRHRSFRALLGQGCGNLTSFLMGGMPGAGAMGPTLINLTSGGQTARSGIVEGVVVMLVLFFGTTDRLFTELEPDLKTKRFILMDMRRVRSIDYTAVNLLQQMHHELMDRHGQLLFSRMPSGVLEGRDLETYLNELGLISGHGVKIWSTMDSAIEWMEEQILTAHGLTVEHQETPLALEEFTLFHGLSLQQLSKIKTSVSELSLKKDERLFSKGDSGDEMLLVRRGGVRVMLPTEGGKYVHLATVSQGSFFGELAFIDNEARSADVEAKWDTDLYVLSRRRFDECSRADPATAAVFFERLAKIIALRLRDTNAALSD